MLEKAPHRSKTILFNLGCVLLVGCLKHWFPDIETFLCGKADLIIMILATINLALRWVTKQPIRGSALLIALILSGCTSVPQQLNPEVKYRNDLPFCVEGYGCFEGVTVLPRLPQYKFEFAPKGDASVDLLVVTTCNRNKTFEPGDKGFVWDFLGLFGGKKKGLKYLYIPLEGKEDDGDCPLIIHTYEKSGGRHAWAMVRFEHPKYTLPATLYCDGDTLRFGGVSLCQGKKGLIQWARFPEPVMIKPGVTEKGAPCPMPVRDDTGDYAWRIAQDECGYTVKGISGRLHDMTTTGYVGEVIREVK